MHAEPTFDAEAYRAEIRDYIAAHAPDLPFRTGTRSPEDEHEAAVLRAWSSSLYTNGFAGTDWPVAHGGRPDAHPMMEPIVAEELARARAPLAIGAGSLASYAVSTYGSEEQKAFFLPRIRSYEHVWCQLFSEPDAGSDLASMRTTAIRDGDHFVVNGQKVWSTNAAFAEYGFLLARTNPDVVKHAGISAFALDMSLPGIEVRPLREMTGTADFNEVFFNDVRMPASAAIGTIDDGWRVATTSLAEERAGVGALVIRLALGLEALIALARRLDLGGRPAAQDPIVRQQLAGFATRVRLASRNVHAAQERRDAGLEKPFDVPMTKLTFANLNWDMGEYGIMLQGATGMLATDDPEAADNGRWQDELLYAKAYTISGGSNEIMRNLLSERGLGLPRT